jgi:hypothetical protein
VSTGWLWLLLAYVGLLAWALRQKHRFVEGPWWFHLRAFLPNWKFYHAVGWMPRLMVRHRQSPTLSQPSPATGAWRMVYPRRERHAWHLLYNPDTNLALAHQNLVDHLANDIATLPEEGRIEELQIYHLVLRHAARYLMGQGLRHPLQMQVELRLVHQTRDQTEVVLCSPWLDLTSVVAPDSDSPGHV